ncbi:MAG: hypothetical protein M1828_002974 [Chrysothrix sp. TS-e1954]|nr:MAG: hypothetical protein M1828_002974 [Chrysothrix sp. TS-e1954]
MPSSSQTSSSKAKDTRKEVIVIKSESPEPSEPIQILTSKKRARNGQFIPSDSPAPKRIKKEEVKEQNVKKENVKQEQVKAEQVKQENGTATISLKEHENAMRAMREACDREMKARQDAQGMVHMLCANIVHLNSKYDKLQAYVAWLISHS